MEYGEAYGNRSHRRPLKIHPLWAIGFRLHEAAQRFITSLGDRSLDCLSTLVLLASTLLESVIWLIPSDVFFFLHFSFWEEMERKLEHLAERFDSMFLFEPPPPKRYVHVLCAPPTASQELILSLALHLATSRADTVMVVLPPKPARRGEPGVGEFHVAWAARRAELLRQRGGNDISPKSDSPEVSPPISSARRRRFSWNWTGRIGMSQPSDVGSVSVCASCLEQTLLSTHSTTLCAGHTHLSRHSNHDWTRARQRHGTSVRQLASPSPRLPSSRPLARLATLSSNVRNSNELNG